MIRKKARHPKIKPKNKLDSKKMKKIFTLVILTLTLTLILTGCGLQVPRPEIKNGEFNFSVTYEYKGETKTVSGVFVCEYAGLEWYLDAGYQREWSGYIKGGEIEDHVMIDIIDGGDEVYLALDLRPDYFMDDFNFDLYGVPAPCIRINDYTEEGLRIIYEAEEVEEICGARIVSYEYDKPIENTFGLFK